MHTWKNILRNSLKKKNECRVMYISKVTTRWFQRWVLSLRNRLIWFNIEWWFDISPFCYLRIKQSLEHECWLLVKRWDCFVSNVEGWKNVYLRHELNWDKRLLRSPWAVSIFVITELTSRYEKQTKKKKMHQKSIKFRFIHAKI